MADTVEPGLGAPMRQMIQNAINKKSDIAKSAETHFSYVTGDVTGGWGKAGSLLGAALESPSGMSDEKVQELSSDIVKSLGVHVDNFEDEFQKLQFDQDATSELHEGLHAIASDLGEHVSTVIKATHLARANASDKDATSDAYQAGYALADYLHNTHSDGDAFSAQVAHELSQVQLKTYRSPISIDSPERIEGIRKRAKRIYKKGKSKFRQAKRAVVKRVVPSRVRGRSKIDSGVAIGGAGVGPYVYLKEGQIGYIHGEGHEISDYEQERFSIVSGRPTGYNLREVQMPGALYSGSVIFSQSTGVVNNRRERDLLPVTIPLTSGRIDANVVLFKNSKSEKMVATGVIFPLSDIDEQSRKIKLNNGFNVKVDARLNINLAGVLQTDQLDFLTEIKKFSKKSRGAFRVGLSIDELKAGGFQDTGSSWDDWPVLQYNNQFYAFDPNSAQGQRSSAYHIVYGVSDSAPIYNEMEFNSVDSVKRHADSILRPSDPRGSFLQEDNDANLVGSFSKELRDGNLLVMQVKKSQGGGGRLRQYINFYFSIIDRAQSLYRLDGAMLVLPRISKGEK